MSTHSIFVILIGLAATSISDCKNVIERAVPAVIENNAPIIGVLTQEVSPKTLKNFPGDHASYIAASYVKFVEAGGARAAPIWIGKPRSYYVDIMKKINGVLLPGGATFFNQTDGYADAGGHIYDIALEMNNNGIYMPIWGTCLGFELLTYVAANKREHRSYCDSIGQLLPLQFKNESKTSRLFKDAPNDVIDILTNKPVTYNWHMYCTTEKSLEEVGLVKDWKIMSTNQDWNGFNFISSIEHKQYPFYGIQFHPEKNTFEWALNKNITHTKESIRSTQYFADFLVNECRKNKNKFPTRDEELDSLIYNYDPTFSGRGKSSYLQMYFFSQDPQNRKGNSGVSSSISKLLFGAILVSGFFQSLSSY